MTTPFDRIGVGYFGVDPGVPIPLSLGGSELWIGQPGAMVQMPTPMKSGYQRDVSFGETEHGHPGGGSSVTEFDPVSRWTVEYFRKAGRDYSVLWAMRRGVGPFATAPWCYLPPEDTNRLTAGQSLCGGLHGVAEGWAVSAGTVAFDSSVAGADMMSGVLRWSSASTNSVLVAGRYSSGVAADTTFGCPYVPSRSWSGSVYAATASGTASVQVQLTGIAADGTTTVATVSGAATTLTTAAQWLPITINPGALGASAYVVLSLKCLSGSAPNLLVSCASLSDSDSPNDWAVGAGVPRVIWPVSPSRGIGWQLASDLTVTLAECYSGGS